MGYAGQGFIRSGNTCCVGAIIQITKIMLFMAAVELKYVLNGLTKTEGRSDSINGLLHTDMLTTSVLIE